MLEVSKLFFQYEKVPDRTGRFLSRFGWKSWRLGQWWGVWSEGISHYPCITELIESCPGLRVTPVKNIEITGWRNYQNRSRKRSSLSVKSARLPPTSIFSFGSEFVLSTRDFFKKKDQNVIPEDLRDFTDKLRQVAEHLSKKDSETGYWVWLWTDLKSTTAFG